MTRVIIRKYDDILRADIMRARYERQKWEEENEGVDSTTETVRIVKKVCETDGISIVSKSLEKK